MSVRQLKSLSKIRDKKDFDKMSKKEQLKAISILIAPVSCEVDKAQEFLNKMEQSCVLKGKMPFIGGSRRRRGRRSRSRSSDTDGSDTDDSSVASQATTQSQQAQAPQQTQAPQQAPQQAMPSAEAMNQATQGDIYDLMSIILLAGATYGAGSLAMASGLDEGFSALLESNGIPNLAHCSSEEILARKMNAAMIGYNVPDYCAQAQRSMNAIIIGAPVAASALCAWFGVRNPFTIMGEAARGAQRGTAASLRSVKNRLQSLFSNAPEPTDAVRNAAAIAIDAQNAAIQAARNSPPAQQRAAAVVAAQATINPTMAPPQRANISPQQQMAVTPVVSQVTQQPPATLQAAIGNSPVRTMHASPNLSPVMEGNTSPPSPSGAVSPLAYTPQSPTYSPNTPQEGTKHDDDDSEMEEGEIQEGSNTPTSIGSVTDSLGRRRSSRRRDGGRKKKTRKHKAKKKGRKGRKKKQTRKHKAKKTRKHKAKKKGRKTKKH